MAANTRNLTVDEERDLMWDILSGAELPPVWPKVEFITKTEGHNKVYTIKVMRYEDGSCIAMHLTP